MNEKIIWDALTYRCKYDMVLIYKLINTVRDDLLFKNINKQD